MNQKQFSRFKLSRIPESKDLVVAALFKMLKGVDLQKSDKALLTCLWQQWRQQSLCPWFHPSKPALWLQLMHKSDLSPLPWCFLLAKAHQSHPERLSMALVLPPETGTAFRCSEWSFQVQHKKPLQAIYNLHTTSARLNCMLGSAQTKLAELRHAFAIPEWRRCPSHLDRLCSCFQTKLFSHHMIVSAEAWAYALHICAKGQNVL